MRALLVHADRWPAPVPEPGTPWRDVVAVEWVEVEGSPPPYLGRALPCRLGPVPPDSYDAHASAPSHPVLFCRMSRVRFGDGRVPVYIDPRFGEDPHRHIWVWCAITETLEGQAVVVGAAPRRS